VYRNERKKQQSALSGLIADTLGNHLLVRIFAREKSEVDASISSRRSIEKIAAKEIDLIERESILRQSLLFGFQIITIAIGIWLFTNNSVSIAALIFAITYLGRLTDSLFSITSIIRQYEQAFLDAAPLTKILSEPPKVTDMPNAKNLAISNGTIEFANITFCYDDGDDVFSSLSLTIAPGQRVGLAGPSGGGKTTLTKLLLRFADVQNGKILIDNQDIAEFTQDSLRSNIAYVPQDTFLFHRTLRENIAYGRPDATEDEIIMAAEKSYAMEFIRKMPQGLDTVVGERGVKLSGGQRQRISIARAFIKDAPILILDEATSALDSESEKLIQKALHELMKNRTSIVIAHRLSTIASLDRIIVIDKGEIVEDDTHTSLIQQQGMYARLWNHQSGGFIED
jgi:ATP-binding cassette subfamily B protein